jgi:DNA-binding response OmpR family regulator
MVNVRPNPESADGTPCRLNLLLSYGGWRDESWADRLPRLLEPMGIRSIRAGTGKEASAAIQATTIHIAVVDLGLPLDQSVPASAAEPAPETSEAGPRLLQILARLSQPPPTVVVKRARTLRDDRREIVAALRAGAFAVIDRPTEPGDVEMLLEVLRRCLRRHYHGRWPGLT